MANARDLTARVPKGGFPNPNKLTKKERDKMYREDKASGMSRRDAYMRAVQRYKMSPEGREADAKARKARSVMGQLSAKLDETKAALAKRWADSKSAAAKKKKKATPKPKPVGVVSRKSPEGALTAKKKTPRRAVGVLNRKSPEGALTAKKKAATKPKPKPTAKNNPGRKAVGQSLYRKKPEGALTATQKRASNKLANEPRSIAAAKAAGKNYFYDKNGNKKAAVTASELSAWKKKHNYQGSNALRAYLNSKGKKPKVAKKAVRVLSRKSPEGALTAKKKTATKPKMNDKRQNRPPKPRLGFRREVNYGDNSIDQ